MKKVIFIVLPLLLIGGGVFLTARMGFINVPGVTPPKKKVMAKKPAKPAPKTEIIKAPETESDQPKSNPAAGQEAVAKLWAEIEPKKLAKLTESWPAADLAPVLMKMDSEKVSELLAELEAKRSSELSREIQKKVSEGK